MSNIEFSKKDLKQALRGVITSPHRENIVNAIIDTCTLTEEIENLALALMGIKREFPFKILDEVWIKINALPTWRMDKSRMRKENLVFKDLVKGTVVKSTDSNQNVFTVEFLSIDLNNQVKKSETYTVDGKYIIPDYDQINLIE